MKLWCMKNIDLLQSESQSQKAQYYYKNKSGSGLLPNRLYLNNELYIINYNSFNNVCAASFPNSLGAKGLAPVINFLSTQTVLSDFVLTIFAPKFC